MRPAKESREPLTFPFGLKGGQTRNEATAQLQTVGLDRDAFDSNFTVWSVGGRIHRKSFRPAGMELNFRSDKLAQVTLVTVDMTDCQEVGAVVQDAVDYIKTHYVLNESTIQTAPHYGSSNCFFYMKAGNVGWQAVQGDYAVSVDSTSKNLKFTGFVTFSYMPLFSSSGH
jgi:hypothetical protein